MTRAFGPLTAPIVGGENVDAIKTYLERLKIDTEWLKFFGALGPYNYSYNIHKNSIYFFLGTGVTLGFEACYRKHPTGEFEFSHWSVSMGFPDWENDNLDLPDKYWDIYRDFDLSEKSIERQIKTFFREFYEHLEDITIEVNDKFECIRGYSEL